MPIAASVDSVRELTFLRPSATTQTTTWKVSGESERRRLAFFQPASPQILDRERLQR